MRGRFPNAARLPGTGEGPGAVYARSIAVAGTPGAEYLERRRISHHLAAREGVRYCPTFRRRPALIAPLVGADRSFRAIHARYIEQRFHEPRMFELGIRGGVYETGQGLDVEPVVLVEGLFDALSLALCDVPSVATMGVWVGESPFSFSAIDIKTLAMGLLGKDYRQSTKSNMPRRWFGPTRHTNEALTDAIEQGELFCNMLAEARRRAR